MMWKEFDKTNGAAAAEMAAFVRGHEHCHFLQMPYWADVKAFWRWRGVTVYRQKQSIATMAVLIRSLPLGLSLFYIPRGPVCDRKDPEVWLELMDALKTLAKKHHAILVFTDPDALDEDEDFRSILGDLKFKETSDDCFGNIQPQHVFRLNLKGKSKEDIFQAFSSKTRYNIGLAQRSGVTVREYSGAEPIPDFIMEDFHSLMEITGKRDHFHTRDKGYFAKLLAALGDDSKLYMAYLQGQPIAGSIEIFCGRKAWYLYGASANEHRNVMPNYLLQWTMIQRAMARNCEIYDLRGVPGNPSENGPLYGLYRFKKGFSGTYTKFTGLFTHTYRPVTGAIFRAIMKLRKKCMVTPHRK